MEKSEKGPRGRKDSLLLLQLERFLAFGEGEMGFSVSLSLKERHRRRRNSRDAYDYYSKVSLPFTRDTIDCIIIVLFIISEQLYIHE